MNTEKFTAQQIESIINKVVPLIAEEDDQEFFRGFLFVKAESCESSSEFSYFVRKYLQQWKYENSITQ